MSDDRSEPKLPSSTLYEVNPEFPDSDSDLVRQLSEDCESLVSKLEALHRKNADLVSSKKTLKDDVVHLRKIRDENSSSSSSRSSFSSFDQLESIAEDLRTEVRGLKLESTFLHKSVETLKEEKRSRDRLLIEMGMGDGKSVHGNISPTVQFEEEEGVFGKKFRLVREPPPPNQHSPPVEIERRYSGSDIDPGPTETCMGFSQRSLTDTVVMDSLHSENATLRYRYNSQLVVSQAVQLISSSIGGLQDCVSSLRSSVADFGQIPMVVDSLSRLQEADEADSPDCDAQHDPDPDSLYVETLHSVLCDLGLPSFYPAMCWRPKRDGHCLVRGIVATRSIWVRLFLSVDLLERKMDAFADSSEQRLIFQKSMHGMRIERTSAKVLELEFPSSGDRMAETIELKGREVSLWEAFLTELRVLYALPF